MSQVSLEVNVQDCFWLSEESETAPKQQKSPVDVFVEDLSSPISPQTWEQWFTQWFSMLNPNIPQVRSYELSLRLTDNTEIQQLNAQYRSLDVPTDVLAFATLEESCPQLPASEMFTSQSLYLGDLVISVETAARQAQQQGHPLKIELGWLAAHGLLHLLGWDHPDDRTLIQMLDQQAIMLQSVGLKVNKTMLENVNLVEYSRTPVVNQGRSV
ncbi:rRNA maturation RNase YbeY [Lyngbya aestuarii]|nr:rRNA maturation RNase YbeY [Lyngbya aestuarii]